MPATEVKICGLSTPDTLRAALDAGAAMVGLVFFPKSPRHVPLDRARELAALARGRAAIVILTVDASDDELAGLVEEIRPDWLQLHGREKPDRVGAVRARFGLPVMKAVGVATRADLQTAALHAAVADRILLDAKPPPDAALPGGNGRIFDWTLLAGLDLPVPFMLSGGLTPANVAQAVRLAGVAGVDVSSGVETAPGVKDVGLIRSFVAAVRQG